MAVEAGSVLAAEQALSPHEVSNKVSEFLDRARHSWVPDIQCGTRMYGTQNGHASVAYEVDVDHEVLSIQLMTLPRKAIIFRDKKSERDPNRIGNCVIFSYLNQKGEIDSIMNTPRAVWEAEVLVGLCDI